MRQRSTGVREKRCKSCSQHQPSASSFSLVQRSLKMVLLGLEVANGRRQLLHWSRPHAIRGRSAVASMRPTLLIMLLLLASLGSSMATDPAQPARKCRNPSCTEAISIVRAFRDYQATDSVFAFKALNTFAVVSKMGDLWEADVRTDGGGDLNDADVAEMYHFKPLTWRGFSMFSCP